MLYLISRMSPFSFPTASSKEKMLASQCGALRNGSEPRQYSNSIFDRRDRSSRRDFRPYKELPCLSLDIAQFHVCGTGFYAGLHLESCCRLAVVQSDTARLDAGLDLQSRCRLVVVVSDCAGFHVGFGLHCYCLSLQTLHSPLRARVTMT